jgi:hypothetical protein
MPRVVQLQRPGGLKAFVEDPQRDGLPRVTLEAPAADTVAAALPTRVALRAAMSDDVGLRDGRFEYIVTSGEGERFTFRDGVLPVPLGAGGRASASLDLAGLALRPGDVVHVRAAATDLNGTVGTSETRALRVFRASGSDSVAVEAAPPPEVDGSLLSQRMLINRTEALVRRARGTADALLRTESARIGRDQARLRRQVSDLVFARLGDDPSGEHFHGDGHAHGEGEALRRPLSPDELLAAADRATGARGAMLDVSHDEAPVVAVSRPLLEAYNAMWDAGRHLEGGRPRAALPPMYLALAAIQKARAAERLYLRGGARPVVVDVARVRLTGRERGGDAVRDPERPEREGRAAHWQRIVGVMSRAVPADSVPALLAVRLALRDDRAAVALVDSLVVAVRAGRDVATPLGALRERLGVAGPARSLRAWRTLP